jgi:molybdopterin converting factor small subunit
MNIKVDFFGGLRHAVGASELEVQLNEAATIKRLLEMLNEQYPELGRLSKLTVISVNHNLATGSEMLKDGDVVSMISALAGG